MFWWVTLYSGEVERTKEEKIKRKCYWRANPQHSSILMAITQIILCKGNNSLVRVTRNIFTTRKKRRFCWKNSFLDSQTLITRWLEYTTAKWYWAAEANTGCPHVRSVRTEQYSIEQCGWRLTLVCTVYTLAGQSSLPDFTDVEINTGLW